MTSAMHFFGIAGTVASGEGRPTGISTKGRSFLGRSVASALLRVQEDSFGTCVHCGKDISGRRLEAVPWTPWCIRCQEAADLGDKSVLESVEPAFLDAA